MLPYQLQAQAEIERRRRLATKSANTAELEQDWRTWLERMFPGYVAGGFAPRHEELWEWGWSIERGIAPSAFIAIWPRGGAKSTSGELLCAAVGAKGTRRYVLYVSATQSQADDHVQNVASLFESPQMEEEYPELASRAVGKFGSSKGWRRNRIRTSSGFTVDALGLDTAARGVKLDEQRPDMLIFDDIDSSEDSLAAVEKKIALLTKTLLPAGSNDMAVLGLQNLIHGESIFMRLVDGRADFLYDRIVSGPHPALEDFEYEQAEDGRWLITAGTPTWAGQDLDACQGMVNRFGITAFLTECQQDVEPPAGGMFDHISYVRCEWAEVPPLVDVQVWVDPAVTNTDKSDSHGMQADGIALSGKIYRLYSWEGRTSPVDSLERAILKAIELKASCVGVETDQGGDTWESVYREACRNLVKKGKVPAGTVMPRFVSAKAGSGNGSKTHRGSQQLAAYETGEFIHVKGTHLVLERAQRRFPKTKPFDLVDVGWHSWRAVKAALGKRPARPAVGGQRPKIAVRT